MASSVFPPNNSHAARHRAGRILATHICIRNPEDGNQALSALCTHYLRTSDGRCGGEERTVTKASRIALPSHHFPFFAQRASPHSRRPLASLSDAYAVEHSVPFTPRHERIRHRIPNLLRIRRQLFYRLFERLIHQTFLRHNILISNRHLRNHLHLTSRRTITSILYTPTKITLTTVNLPFLSLSPPFPPPLKNSQRTHTKLPPIPPLPPLL